MFPQRAQDRSRLPVHGGKVVELAAKMNRAVGHFRRAEINLFARGALQVGKQTRGGVGVVVNVAARSGATAHAFPAVKAAVGKTIARGGGKNGSVQHGAIQEPERQAGIIPGIAPQLGLAFEAGKIRGDVCGNGLRRGKFRGVIPAAIRKRFLDRKVGEMPGEHKRHRF